MKVLGLSMSSRLLAIAIIKKDDLQDFHLHFFKEKWSKRKREKIIGHITACIDRHSTTNIALTIPHPHHQNKETKALIKQITTYCQDKACIITTYPPESFQVLFQQSRAKKKALMQSLVEQYPELIFTYRKELQNKRKYYHKLFEAIAAGTLLARELNSKMSLFVRKKCDSR